MCWAANSMSASGMTIAWLLAPPRAWTRLPWDVPVSWMTCATGEEPTKLIASMPSWVRISPTSVRSPAMTLKRPSGRPASLYRRAMQSEAEGTREATLRMKALPVASAIGCIHMGTMTGKLKGAMPATTPTGWRSVWTSTPVDAWSVNSPLSAALIPHAKSTVSRPRAISPRASPWVFPPSRTMMPASSSWCSMMSWRNLNMTSTRLASGVRAHSAWAARATRTTWSRSAESARRSSSTASPVAGSSTGSVRVEDAWYSRPSTQSSIAIAGPFVVFIHEHSFVLTKYSTLAEPPPC